MIYHLIDFLRSTYGMKIPYAFQYCSTRMMLAAFTSVVISIFLGPIFIKKLYELKIGQPIRMDECPLLGQLHEKKKDTPTMGGALILFSIIVSMALWMDLRHPFTLILFLTAVVLGLLGARDDYLKLKYKNAKGLSGKKKLLVQGALGAILALYLLYPPATESIHTGSWFEPPVVKEHIHQKGQNETIAAGEFKTQSTGSLIPFNDYAKRIYIPFYKEPVWIMTGIGVVLAALLIIIVVTGASNAVNLTDGLDGLAAGCLILVAGSLALIAFMSNHINLSSYLNILYIEGSGEIAIFLSALVGACIGFLWYNGHPAQVFMGDTGSLALGGIIGVSAVLLKRELLLALIGGIFVAEAMSVILQVASYKLRNRKRIFLCAPLHHHFEYKGWAETKVVIRFWIVGLLLAILGMISLKFQ